MTAQHEVPFNLYDKVYDTLTGDVNEVIGYMIEMGRKTPDSTNYMNAVTYYIDNPYLDGVRFVHEIRKVDDNE